MGRMRLPQGYRVVVVPESRKDEFVRLEELTWADTPNPETAEQAPPETWRP